MHSQIFRRFAAGAALLALSGCGAGHALFGGNNAATLGQSSMPPSVFGYAVADEPEAALIGRAALNAGGNAADAAAAEGFALSVTLPSRASLGGGGACLIKMPNAKGEMQPPIALMFPAGAPAASGGTRPAAVPTLARGLLAMQARFGQLPFSSVVVPAERLAGGVPVSPALAADLQVVGNALLADPAAASVFGANGRVLPAGANLVQPDLAATLEMLRTQGIQGFYNGNFAQQFATAADAAGGGLTAADLDEAAPHFEPPMHGSAGKFATAALPVAPAASTNLPASAAFGALDKNGGSVICVTSLNNLFGTGRIAAGTGILLAASPRSMPTPDLAATMAYNPSSFAFRAAATGTGQNQAETAATIGLANALANSNTQIPNPGRANIISCPGLVPGGQASCTASADPRGHGLAIGGR